MHTLAGYEWDPKKAAANLQKHGVDFVDAAGVFADDLAVTVRDSISSIDEERFVIVGTGALGQVLVVVYV